jgi:flagellar assembly factor FliW
MLLETTRFGVVEVDDSEVFTVPGGIPGFPDLSRVTLFGAGSIPGFPPEDEHSLFWLQDLDNPALAFMCVVPWVAFPDYDFEVDEQELGIESPDDVRILTLVSVRREDGAANMTTNLRAPLVIDARNQRLHQVILSDSRWPIRAALSSLVSNEVR